MAYVNADRTQRAGLMARLANFQETWTERRARHAVYRRTRAELETLTDRDLSDLGIHRSDVRRIAYQAAYGS